MKKSEMIKLIGDELWEILPSHLCKYADADARTILRRIEEEGMMPPANGFTGDEIIYEWEPEDD